MIIYKIPGSRPQVWSSELVAPLHLRHQADWIAEYNNGKVEFIKTRQYRLNTGNISIEKIVDPAQVAKFLLKNL